VKPKKQIDADDERPDAWQRFEQAVDVALHTRPSHKAATAQKSRRKKPKKHVKSRS
jgi:hypothetical protein